MSGSQSNLSRQVTERMRELQNEVEAKAKVMPDGSSSLEQSKDALALFIGVFHETKTYKEAADQVEKIVKEARQKR